MKHDEKIALSLHAHNILTVANMEKGYTRNEASKAAYDAMKQMPADVKTNLLKRIVAGDAEVTDLYRWPIL